MTELQGPSIFTPLHRMVALIERFPWVARIYFLLVMVFLAVLIWTSTRQGPNPLPDNDLHSKLFTLCADGLKTVLGALLGSLSLAAESMWRTPHAAASQTPQAQLPPNL
jgi:hypothetical protein